MRRKCSVCKKVRECRTNNGARVINNVQALCRSCNKKQAAEWYQENRAWKDAYNTEYRKDNQDFLVWLKRHYKNMTPEEKLKALISKRYLDE